VTTSDGKLVQNFIFNWDTVELVNLGGNDSDHVLSVAEGVPAADDVPAGAWASGFGGAWRLRQAPLMQDF